MCFIFVSKYFFELSNLCDEENRFQNEFQLIYAMNFAGEYK